MASDFEVEEFGRELTPKEVWDIRHEYFNNVMSLNPGPRLTQIVFDGRLQADIDYYGSAFDGRVRWHPVRGD